jgi:hypothetical protein
VLAPTERSFSPPPIPFHRYAVDHGGFNAVVYSRRGCGDAECAAEWARAYGAKHVSLNAAVEAAVRKRTRAGTEAASIVFAASLRELFTDAYHLHSADSTSKDPHGRATHHASGNSGGGGGGAAGGHGVLDPAKTTISRDDLASVIDQHKLTQVLKTAGVFFEWCRESTPPPPEADADGSSSSNSGGGGGGDSAEKVVAATEGKEPHSNDTNNNNNNSADMNAKDGDVEGGEASSKRGASAKRKKDSRVLDLAKIMDAADYDGHHKITQDHFVAAFCPQPPASASARSSTPGGGKRSVSKEPKVAAVADEARPLLPTVGHVGGIDAAEEVVFPVTADLPLDVLTGIVADEASEALDGMIVSGLSSFRYGDTTNALKALLKALASRTVFRVVHVKTSPSFGRTHAPESKALNLLPSHRPAALSAAEFQALDEGERAAHREALEAYKERLREAVACQIKLQNDHIKSLAEAEEAEGSKDKRSKSRNAKAKKDSLSTVQAMTSWMGETVHPHVAVERASVSDMECVLFFVL